jgi:hypothetical protein
MKPQITGISGGPNKNSNTDRLIQAVLDSSCLSSGFVKLSKISVPPASPVWDAKKTTSARSKTIFPN